MTLRSAAGRRGALRGNLCFPHTLIFHLYFTPITVDIRLVISYSQAFDLVFTWSARCPMAVSQLTGQGLEASFDKALNKVTSWFSSEAFNFWVLSFPCPSKCLWVPSWSPWYTLKLIYKNEDIFYENLQKAICLSVGWLWIFFILGSNFMLSFLFSGWNNWWVPCTWLWS